MALFDKLFSTKRKLDDVTRGSRDRISSCQITPEQVRLLLFKECDRRGRKLLFDSCTIEKVPAAKNDKPNISQTKNTPYIVEVSSGFTYRYKGPAEDATVLGEMIFGAVALNCRGVSLKIHIMDEPRRFMCTKVFNVPTSRRISRVDRRTGEQNSPVDTCNSSKPLNVPSQRGEGVSLSFSLGRGDSGFYGDHSMHSSVSSTYDCFSMFDIWDENKYQEDFSNCSSSNERNSSMSSNGSWQRRTFQNITTKFDIGQKRQSSNLLSVPSSVSNMTSYDSQIYSNGSRSGTCDSLSSVGSSVIQRRRKLGLALLITVADSAEMDMIQRCVEHSPQIQALMCRLRLATLAAAASSAFIATMHSAVDDAAKWLSFLMYGPRLQPIWLNLVTSEQSRTANKLAETLLSDLCSVLAVGDTKHTNFFVSTLLTHVLTYHLGWVTTVSPYDTPDIKICSQEPAKQKRHYNALWAQLSDLCGSIGFPPRAARTIISGTNNNQFMNRLLLVLTYFVRCGDVLRTEFRNQDCTFNEKVFSINSVNVVDKFALKRPESPVKNYEEFDMNTLKLPLINTQNSDSSVSTLVSSEVSIKRSATLANLKSKLSSSNEFALESNLNSEKSINSQFKRSPTAFLPMKTFSDSSLSSSVSEESDIDQKVVFVLGDNEKLVGLKNKSIAGKCVKKSSKVQNEPIKLEIEEKEIDVNETVKDVNTKTVDDLKLTGSEIPSKCCGQTLQHSKLIKHSGFKFEFDKYPQIVTNYMKSKNLEILDRHYIGKPGNLKLDNFQFDPTVVPPIQEERCEICYRCQHMESILQTPTNASELEYMNDVPRQSEVHYATETIVQESDKLSDISPKTYVRKRKENTLVVNTTLSPAEVTKPVICVELNKPEIKKNKEQKKVKETRGLQKEVKQILEFPLDNACMNQHSQVRAGFDSSLLGGLTDHYVPDLILQGITANCNTFEAELRRDLDITSYLNRKLDSSIQAVGIIGDTNTWDVRVIGRDCGAGGMSTLVGGMLDALSAMRKAKVPVHLCMYYLESKLREFCVLSKTLADMLMSTDFCDITTLTKSLNVDVNDIPLLLAVATIHTPQVASRYGISFR